MHQVMYDRLSVNLRVRFAETDQMGVAHHSAYVIWFEAARVEWLRERGLDYRELETSGISLAVSAVSVQYLESSRFDDELVVQASLTELKSRRVRYHYEVTRGDKRLAFGDSVQTPVNSSGRALRLPEMWLGVLRPHVVIL